MCKTKCKVMCNARKSPEHRYDVKMTCLDMLVPTGHLRRCSYFYFEYLLTRNSR